MVDMRVAEMAVKSLWKDKLTVVEHQKVKKDNGATGFTDVVVLVDEPCKLCFDTVSSVEQQEAARLVQSVSLLCDKKIDIKPGSKLLVVHENEEIAYARSGMPAVYSVHQKLVLELFERWT